MRRLLACFLCLVCIVGLLSSDAYAIQPIAPAMAKRNPLSRVMDKLGSGPDALVAVSLRDKTVVNGWVAHSGATQFVLVESSTGRQQTVAYEDVSRLAGYNLTSGVQVDHGGGIRAKLSRVAGHLLPGTRVRANSLTGGQRTLLIGIVIGILIAIILAKAL